jgi:hypothetical protein
VRLPLELEVLVAGEIHASRCPLGRAAG